jgi:hypothetical protein
MEERMSTVLVLTRKVVGSKLKWGWICEVDGVERCGSARFFTSKEKAIADFNDIVCQFSLTIGYGVEFKDI